MLRGICNPLRAQWQLPRLRVAQHLRSCAYPMKITRNKGRATLATLYELRGNEHD